MGFIEDLTVYVWNWFVWMTSMSAVGGCWMNGWWGLFFDNDDGEILQACLDIVGGSAVEFPVEYVSSYAEI